MPDKTSYQQLQPEERLAIASLRLQDVSIRAMALILGRSPATVESRTDAKRLSLRAMHQCRLKRGSTARRSAGRRPASSFACKAFAGEVVLTLLEWKWSPQQISGTLKRMVRRESRKGLFHLAPARKETDCSVNRNLPVHADW